jgi:hypothetical protein
MQYFWAIGKLIVAMVRLIRRGYDLVSARRSADLIRKQIPRGCLNLLSIRRPAYESYPCASP